MSQLRDKAEHLNHYEIILAMSFATMSWKHSAEPSQQCEELPLELLMFDTWNRLPLSSLFLGLSLTTIKTIHKH